MNVIFKSPDLKQTYKRKIPIKNFAYKLLNDFYKNLQLDILSNYETNKPLDRDKYKDELESILRIIYQKTYLKYNFLIDNYTIQSTQKATNKITGSDKIRNLMSSVKTSIIDKILRTRATTIFDNLEKKINELFTISDKQITQQTQDIATQNIKLNEELLKYRLIEPTQNVLNQISKINTQIATNNRIIQNTVANKKDLIKDLFTSKYNEEVVKNRAILQSNNEVDFFYSKLKQGEAETLQSNINDIKLNDEVVKTFERFKRWNAELDKRTRISHAYTNGQVVKITDDFEVNNPRTGIIEYASQPQDETLSPENSINCRCEAEYFFLLKY